MDSIDKQILLLIQENATLPLVEISKRVGISATPCWNRVKKMEEQNIILGRQTLIDRYSINLPIVVFLSISVSAHSSDWVNKFQNVIDRHEEIMEVHRLTGSTADYVMKIVSKSIEDYDKFQQKLISELKFEKMSSSISLQEMKQTCSLPLEEI